MNRIITVVTFLFLGMFGATIASAANTVCLLDGKGGRAAGMPDCKKMGSICGDENNVANGAVALRLNGPRDSFTPVDVYSKCRYLDNASSAGYFVPFKSGEEWSAFLENLPTGVDDTHCARPFPSGIDTGKGLYFGVTTKKGGMGDGGDPSRFAVKLPYWRTGETWPPAAEACKQEHKFSHTCYKEYVVPKCWDWRKRTCTKSKCKSYEGDVCTDMRTYKYDCSYCADKGSTCGKQWQGWSETYDFMATAQDSDVNPYKTVSWTGTSKRTSGVDRPDVCNIRCEFNGHDCTCPSPPPEECMPTECKECVNNKLVDNGTCLVSKCGTSNGQSFPSKPTSNLCAPGDPSLVTGSGPWNWSCKTSAGSRVYCAADKVQFSDCGSSHGEPFSIKPTSGLCTVPGTSSAVTGYGPWNWTCKTEGYSPKYCNANYAPTCTPTSCKSCNGIGSLVNKPNGETCQGSNSGWCLNGRCQAYFFDVCSGTKDRIACWKSPSRANSRGGNKLLRTCTSKANPSLYCRSGRKNGGDNCTQCPDTWGSGRSGEWGHTVYFD